MAFTLWDFLLSSLLFINSVAILNEERFLSRIGWGKGQMEPSGYHGDQAPSVKRQMIQLMAAVRTLLRIPLIILNLVAAALLMVFG